MQLSAQYSDATSVGAPGGVFDTAGASGGKPGLGLSVGGDYFHSPGDPSQAKITGYDAGVGAGAAPGFEVHWGQTNATPHPFWGQ